jgi:hypothetical protein
MFDLAAECGAMGNPTIKALPTQGAQFDLGHVQPTAMFGCVVNLESVSQSFGFGWRKGLVQAGRRVGVELIHYQHQFLGSPTVTMNFMLSWPNMA